MPKKTSNPSSNPDRTASRGSRRLILRIGLAAVTIACLALRLTSLPAPDAASIDTSRWLVVTVAEGSTYGSSTLHLNDDVTAPGLDDEALLNEIRTQAANRDGILLQVAPGVYQSEVGRIRELLSGGQSTVPVRLRRYHPSRLAP